MSESGSGSERIYRGLALIGLMMVLAAPVGAAVPDVSGELAAYSVLGLYLIGAVGFGDVAIGSYPVIQRTGERLGKRLAEGISHE